MNLFFACLRILIFLPSEVIEVLSLKKSTFCSCRLMKTPSFCLSCFWFGCRKGSNIWVFPKIMVPPNHEF